jgi:uncharacterized membrane protein
VTPNCEDGPNQKKTSTMAITALVILSKVLAAVVTLEHLYFMYFEAFAWTTVDLKTLSFKLESKNFAVATQGLAANQGVYIRLLLSLA